jgi:hypothetical protein
VHVCFHDSVAKDSSRMGYYAVSEGDQILIFQGNVGIRVPS